MAKQKKCKHDKVVMVWVCIDEHGILAERAVRCQECGELIITKG